MDVDGCRCNDKWMMIFARGIPDNVTKNARWKKDRLVQKYSDGRKPRPIGCRMSDKR